MIIARANAFEVQGFQNPYGITIHTFYPHISEAPASLFLVTGETGSGHMRTIELEF